MFTRRMFVALVALFALSAAPAFAGGGGGTKKDSTIKVVNLSASPVWAFVDVPLAQVQAVTTAAQAKALGGKEIASGKNSQSFSVKAGPHTLIVADPAIPAILYNATVTTSKGKTSTFDVF